MTKKNILMIEPKAAIRQKIYRETEKYGEMEVTATAKTLVRGYELSRDKENNVLILDGRLLLDEDLEFTCKLMSIRPMQLIVTADAKTYDSLMEMKADKLCMHNLIMIDSYDMDSGVQDVIGAVLSHDQMIRDITNRYEEKMKQSYASVSEPVIAIGASTGGVTAIEMVLTGFEGAMPPVLMVQHMSKTFTEKMAQRLASITRLEVVEAKEGDCLRRNVAYLAPGNRHMTIRADGGHYRICLDEGPLVHYQRPAVDRLFESVAKEAGEKSIGVLLTGMGKDGAMGMKKMKDRGAYTIAQDAASSVIFGMPKAAIDIGAACEVASVDHISERVQELCQFSGHELTKVKDAV